MRGKGVNSLYGKIMLALGFALLWSGCGISTTAYLYPPLDFSVDQSSITIRNNGLNYESSEGVNQTFKGINIYYRIFQDKSNAQGKQNDLLTLKEGYEGNPDAFMNYAETQGFCYMRKATSSAQPTVIIAANNESQHTINTTTWEEKGLDNDSNYILVRNINRPENNFLEKNFDADDQDYTGNDSTGGGTFHMVLFAVSYGEDSIGAPVYSDPFIADSILEF